MSRKYIFIQSSRWLWPVLHGCLWKNYQLQLLWNPRCASKRNRVSKLHLLLGVLMIQNHKKHSNTNIEHSFSLMLHKALTYIKEAQIMYCYMASLFLPCYLPLDLITEVSCIRYIEGRSGKQNSKLCEVRRNFLCNKLSKEMERTWMQISTI